MRLLFTYFLYNNKYKHIKGARKAAWARLTVVDTAVSSARYKYREALQGSSAGPKAVG